MMVSTARSIEPRCTGMWGALATSVASASNTAHEKASRGGEWHAHGREHRLLEFCAAADRLDRNCFHHKFLGLTDESEPRFMRGLESGLHGCEGRRRWSHIGACTRN